jgi:cell division protease FtsH
MFLPGQDGSLQRDCSEDTARKIDDEVKRMLDDRYIEAKNILNAHRDQLEAVAQELLKHESMDADTFKRMIGQPAESKPSSDTVSSNAESELHPATP